MVERVSRYHREYWYQSLPVFAALLQQQTDPHYYFKKPYRTCGVAGCLLPVGACKVQLQVGVCADLLRTRSPGAGGAGAVYNLGVEAHSPHSRQAFL